MATHLITGVTGQDGILLARLLLARGDRVLGTCRSGTTAEFGQLLDGVEVVAHDVRDIDGFARLIQTHRPDSVVNLAALTSVGASWEHPEVAREVNQDAVAGMLAVLQSQPRPPRFIQASSSEIFGPPASFHAVTDETAPLDPQSPYAEAKAAAHLAVQQARADGLAATNLVLFGHTGPLQATSFVIPTLTHQAALIRLGRATEVTLRDPTICRDWGRAEDVVRAFVAALDGPEGDYVIATGELHLLGEVADWALAAAGSTAHAQVAADAPPRPNDFGGRVGDIRRAARDLNWSPTLSLRDEVEHMVDVAAQRLLTGIHYDAKYLNYPRFP